MSSEWTLLSQIFSFFNLSFYYFLTSSLTPSSLSFSILSHTYLYWQHDHPRRWFELNSKLTWSIHYSMRMGCSSLLSPTTPEFDFNVSLHHNDKTWPHFVGYRNRSMRRYLIEINHCFKLVFQQSKMEINQIIGGRGDFIHKKNSRKRHHIFLWHNLNGLQKRYSSISFLHT